MMLRASSFTLALSIQEAADSMMASGLRDGLQDAVGTAHSGMAGHVGHAHYYVDHSGDTESGDVIYTCDPDGDGDTDYMSAPYSRGTDSSDSDYSLDVGNAHQVAMQHSWVPVGDEADHYAAMREAKLYTSGPVPVSERFVSKKERDAAGSSDFAGKGKSFPILKAADVKAAASSLGRAGAGNYSPAVIKANIIKIAKAKGFTSSLPKAWQDEGTDASESQRPEAEGMRLVECAVGTEEIQVQESARADYEIKLIAPGPGAMAYYPADVLKRDGPSAFPAETKVYVNHPTKTQEAEGQGNRDVYRLAGVLTTPAEYKESHPKGPGLFARMKVFADHAALLAEKGKYLGMSIMANGKQAVESGRPAVREGLPVLGRITRGESVDVVPIAGAGGMILQESAQIGASTPTKEAAGMTAEEVAKLVEAALRKDRLPEVARAEATRLLESVSLRPETKLDVVEGVLRGNIPTKADGSLDCQALAPLVVTEAQRIGRIVAREGGTGVRGMGIGATAAMPKPEDIAAREASAAREMAEDIRIYESLGMTKRGAELAARGREAA